MWRRAGLFAAIVYMIGLPRTSMAFSMRISTPMPASAPAWVCSRGSSLAKIASRMGPLSCSTAVPKKRRNPEFELAVALRLEVCVHDADAPVGAEVFQDAALGPLPVGEVFVIEHDHAALGCDVGPFAAAGREQARVAVVPGTEDQRLDGVGEPHGHAGFLAGVAARVAATLMRPLTILNAMRRSSGWARCGHRPLILHRIKT